MSSKTAKGVEGQPEARFIDLGLTFGEFRALICDSHRNERVAFARGRNETELCEHCQTEHKVISFWDGLCSGRVATGDDGDGYIVQPEQLLSLMRKSSQPRAQPVRS